MGISSKEVAKYLVNYSAYMEEIKARAQVIDQVEKCYSENGNLTGSRVTDYDACLIQVRKICELIMFSCICAHAAKGQELSKKLRKLYKPEDIKRVLSNVSDDYYPRAIIREEGRELPDGRKTFVAGSVNDNILTIDGLIKVWSASGDSLHAKRVGGLQCSKADFANIFEFYKNVVGLLSHHWIRIDDTYQFAVLMNAGGRGDVQVVLLEKTADPFTS